MKSLSKTLLGLLLCLTTAAGYSQAPRPQVFSQFPAIIDCSPTQFSNAFTAKEGQTVTFSFSNNLSFTGKIITNVQKYDNLQSLTIQVKDYANAVFHLSKQTNEDKTFSYVGRILSTEAADGYEIKKEAGKYTLHKIEEDKLRQLCSH